MSHLLALLTIAPADATSRLFVEQTLEARPAVVDAPPMAFSPNAPTPRMKEWLRKNVLALGSDEERMRRLLSALASDRRLEYDASYTGTADEVFESGRFNCLALTHLLVGLGREIGVDTYYVRVEQFRSFHRQQDLLLVSTHVAAGWGPRGQIQIVELEETTERELRSASRISDDEALALHLSNRGAEWLQAGEPGAAQSWLERAVEVDPTLTEAWVNSGVAHRRLGELDQAEAAYRKAIAIDPDNLSAWRNLGLLFQVRGDSDAADELLRLLDRPDNRNPFTYLALGDLGLEAGRLDEAVRFYRRARRIDPGNPETLAALASWAMSSGDLERARALWTRAQALAADSERVTALGSALGPVPLPQTGF